MKRVLLYSPRSLFAQGIQNLLDAAPECQVIGWESDLEKAVERIQELQPDTILVVNRSASDSLVSIGQRFLKVGGNTKIIELNLEDSKGCVYIGEWFVIQNFDDLVKMVEEPVTGFSEKSGRDSFTGEPKEKKTY